ncbi:MAG: hypothetical protein KC646_00250 [Candidatus Cloacimonetes bacterium]|nr:hypothetical protein [Candidatus Cloacimonadota bacterium]
MKNSISKILIMTLGFSVSFANPQVHSKNASVIQSLRLLEQNLSNLKYSRKIQFKSENAKFLYNKSLRDLRDTIDYLSDSQDDQDFENFRGRATIILRDELSFAYIDEAIRALPNFVSENDLIAIKELSQQPQNFVSSNLSAYFKNHPKRPKLGSKKGQAAVHLSQEVMRPYLNACLEALPQYVSQDDLLALIKIVDDSSQPKIANSLKSYFNTK